MADLKRKAEDSDITGSPSKQRPRLQSTGKFENLELMDWSIFKDPVHGSIRLHPVLVSIIDTPQFQRLRDIKQLGATYWTFPGACHNRFEHSIGTSHLCGLLLETLKKQHSELITDKDILCIQIAGLCHDLGHGPFSHVFDSQYRSVVSPGSKWSHEQGSVDMLDHLVQENTSVREVFERFEIKSGHIEMVKDLILGKDPREDMIMQKCMYEGTEREKWFLYEIVSNKRNGIDCDKFDYLMRDCHYVGTKSNFDCMRYFQNTRIILVDNQLQICVRDKEVFNLYEMFHMRWALHHRVYQHKTTKIVEHMLVEALSKVDEKFGIFCSTQDMASYSFLTDSIIYEILRSKEKDTCIKEAQEIIIKLQKRKLYKFCGQVNALLSSDETQVGPSSQQIIEKGERGIAREISDMHECLSPEDIIVNIVNISFGMKNHDPIHSMIFFSKYGKPVKLRKENISEILPQTFREKYIRAYCRDPGKRRLVEESFNAWCSENGFIVPNVLDGDKSGYFTDAHKSSAVKQQMAMQRSDSLKSNMKVRRSILCDDD